MSKLKHICVLLGFIALILAVTLKNRQVDNSHPQPEAIVEFTFQQAIDLVSKEEIKSNLIYLASDQLEGRMSGKKGNFLAAAFVKKEFEKFGLKTLMHRFKIKRMNPGPKNELGEDYTENVYAYIEGSDDALKSQVVVIGAHLDHIGYGPSMSRSSGLKVHPGADDNASGTVALIEIARCFSKLKPRRTVVFMAFSAEEMGLLGSKFYCENPLFPLDNPDMSSHVFMLNMDMIGYLGQGRHQVYFSNGDSSVEVGKIIDGLSLKYSFAKKITGRRSGGSDHACFYNKKVPIAFLHTGLHSHYHKPSDTPDKINYDGLFEIAKYAFELSYLIVQAQNRPEFDYGSFVEMDLKHDHGQQEFPQ